MLRFCAQPLHVHVSRGREADLRHAVEIESDRVDKNVDVM